MYGLNNGIPVSLKSIPSFGIAPQNQLTAAIQTLFWDGSQGYWFDNNDPSTMFQDSAGTTPVTAVEQFVGLQLDKSQGAPGNQGPDIIVNGDYSAGTANWTAFGTNLPTLSAANNQLTVSLAGPSGSAGAYQAITTVIGKWYIVRAPQINSTGVSPRLSIGTTIGGVENANVVVSNSLNSGAIFLATATTTYISLRVISNTAGVDVIWGPVSTRELPGNHRFQTTSGSRPRWSKRVNLLTKTEQFDDAAWTKSNSFVQTNLLTYSEQFDNNAAWVKSPASLLTFQGTGLQAVVTANFGADPNGAMTAERIQLNCNGGTTPGDRSGFSQTVSVVLGLSYTTSFYVKPLDSTTDSQILASFLGVLAAGGTETSSSITDVGNGWKRVVRVFTAGSGLASFRFQLIGSFGPATFDGLIWGAQLVQGATPGDYQQTTSATAAVQYAAPDGTLTADKLVENTASSTHYVHQVLAPANNTAYSFSCFAKAGERSVLWLGLGFTGGGRLGYDLANGTVVAGTISTSDGSITPVGNGWYRCTLAVTTTSTSVGQIQIGCTNAADALTISYAGDGTSGIYIWGADLRPANQATGTIPLYQRVDTSSDYDTNGFPGYLAADGSDDWMQTNSIDFSGTDKVTLCAGLRKLSDAALGVVTELSATIASNNGTFALEAPAGASPSFNFASKGTTLANNTAQQFIAPITQTVTGIGDIAAARNTIRVGGVDSGVNPASQGTGNYGNFPVYFFRRGGTANAFNGYEYSNIAVGKLLTASQLASLEQYTYSKTINPDGAIYADQAGFSWDSAASPPNSTTYTGSRFITPTHEGMRRCLLLDNGTVNYYLDPNDSTKKADGTAADLTGADGQVMVEIPAFYTRRTVVGTVTTWEISSTPATGFTLHPAFTKDGVDVPFRYYGAYDACVYDVSTSTYISGLNWDNNSGAGNGVEVDVTASTGDVLASVSGIYPMVGLQRAEFRTIAANRGSGWRQVDWTLWSAVQLLYLIEYQSFYSQNILGAGNTNGSYLTASGNQNQSPHTIAGASNSLGNISTNTTTGAGVNAKPGTSFMCYRGIENFYGNVWNWADGVIINPDGTASANQGDWWFTNNSADFSDSVRTNMTQITNGAATANGFVSAIASSDHFFVGTSTSGGSSTTFLTDQLFASTTADRVVHVGGSANDGANAGAFYVNANVDASNRNRSVGARLAR